METQPNPSEASPPRGRIPWWGIALQILLALITAGLVYAIILPAIIAPKSEAPPPEFPRRGVR